MERPIRCEKCGRYFFTAFGTVVLRMTCTDTKCKHINDVKVVSTDHIQDLTFTFPPKKVK